MGPLHRDHPAREEVTDEVLMVRFQAGDRAGVRAPGHEAQEGVLQLRPQARPVGLRGGGSGPGRVREGRPERGRLQARVEVLHLGLHHRAEHLHRPPPQDVAPAAPLARPGAGRLAGRAHAPRSHGGRAPSASAERTAIGAQVAQRIVRCVEALPQEQREVFLLREVGEPAVQGHRRITGVPENTVKSRMRYALERLQESLVGVRGLRARPALSGAARRAAACREG